MSVCAQVTVFMQQSNIYFCAKKNKKSKILSKKERNLFILFPTLRFINNRQGKPRAATTASENILPKTTKPNLPTNNYKCKKRNK